MREANERGVVIVLLAVAAVTLGGIVIAANVKRTRVVESAIAEEKREAKETSRRIAREESERQHAAAEIAREDAARIAELERARDVLRQNQNAQQPGRSADENSAPRLASVDQRCLRPSTNLGPWDSRRSGRLPSSLT